MILDRAAFGGDFMIPIDQQHFKRYWPPSHIRCNCGELAKHIYRQSNHHRYETFKWQCEVYERLFGLKKGTQKFYLINEAE